ncbi:MAG: hypothetical protein GC185_13775 [Alphaproteobacteria bacterium]|nr:hypothetical protein [Alphaproteobacteria bacterium]
MEEDDKTSPEKTPQTEQAAKPAPKKTYERPKLSEDRLRDKDGKLPPPPRKHDYGSKAQLILVAVMGILLLAVMIFSHLRPHPKPQKAQTATEAPAKQQPKATKVEIPKGMAPPSSGDGMPPAFLPGGDDDQQIPAGPQ